MDPPPVCFYDQLCACMRVCVQIGWFRINGYSEIVKTTLNGERAIYPDRVYPIRIKFIFDFPNYLFTSKYLVAIIKYRKRRS